ncbi:CpaF family protein [Pectobacterium odoriferum]|uniref:Pilus assembly protein CpaF n=1 Tax=Pectobacterium odoriferum TaxID=78398 RepID=A0ABD6VV89_9GAMM|nr:CpaF family protein [Pectobacterium odoriferum]QQG27891.1 CpaF family protein [Pectobacterium carotovorum]AIU87342.1 pilus assembly protein CpaF [Pectobacterium odoriferum]KGA42744.1 pilus assembly protein CpaF [Pectobacterium odoriferum]MBA0189402.1 CpaF family protein [Pectobacterium odoriferum]MCA6962070.1 CpaF family protein [Pectobacterium odoriferum]
MLIRKNNLQKSEAGKSTPQPAPAANVAELKTRPAAENRTQPAANTSSGASPAARQTDNRTSQRRIIRAQLYDQIDAGKAAMMGRDKLLVQIETVIRRICDEQRLQLSRQEEEAIAAEMLDEMTGIGPIQPLLSDDTVNDILVNGAGQVFVERFGKLELSPITFIDEEHVFNTAQRIAAAVGRRIDEASPMVDARLPDGSRVNVITYPLAIDGTTISIRKFMRRNLSLEMLAERRCMSYAMADVLNKAMQARVNVIVSGGTGAGKTTLLNALSQKIGITDRIITIEDAAELQLQQEHVVRLETRPVSAEGTGRVDQRDLMRNALRMRPDRIILGEVRGGESFDMLQAMNTGHDGSLCTVHANTSRDAIQRLENMVMMANMQLPLMAIRRQIASAVHLIVQIERMRDGMRRVVSITEVCGMENEVIQLQDLFSFNIQGMDGQGLLTGEYVQHIQRPQFYSDKAHLFDAQ